jgi:hypothetical protein
MTSAVSDDIEMSFFGRKMGGGGGSGTEHTGRNLQDGLFQIASQACHILVQVSWRSKRGEYAG